MREKLIKRNNRYFLIYTFVVLAFASFVLIWGEMIPYRNIVIGVGAVILVIASYIIERFRRETDKQYIEIMVEQGNIALAKIKNATLVHRSKENFSVTNKLFELDVDVIDKNLNSHSTKIIDMFSDIQQSFDEGHVYITYDGTDESILIIPTFLIQKHSTNYPLIDKYEKSIKDIKNLNVLYNNGLIIETFIDSMKRSQMIKNCKK